MRIFYLLFLLIISSSFAGVNLKNGNYYISYTDLVIPGAENSLKLQRTYNSKSIEKGWFGFGWGSDFETFCKISADGSFVIHENGAGNRTRFTPKGSIDEKTAAIAADKIIKKMRQKGIISQSQVKSLKFKLIKNEEFRHLYAKKYDVGSKLKKNAWLYSNLMGPQKVKVLDSGYIRYYQDGKKQFFDKKCRLTKITDNIGYTISLRYENNNVSMIKDSEGKQILLKWYSDGKIKEASAAGRKKTAYQYNNKNNLIQSQDITGQIYKYSYDKNHNLVRVTYQDGKEKTIEYDGKTQFVTRVIKKNGEDTKYSYGSNPKNPNYDYWTEVSRKGADGQWMKNRYEYELKVKKDGSNYTYRTATIINGVKTETLFSECCSQPIRIQRGKRVTNFEYNKNGLLTKKSSTDGTMVELKYDEKLNKIKYVKDNRGWTEFKYDKKGNLKKARNNQGKIVSLIYDMKGRIKNMSDFDPVSKKRRELTFSYNRIGKPEKIQMKNVGTLKVIYDRYGEVKKVDSKSGPKMALEVTSAFRSLLKIVEPAGVSIGI